MAPARLEIGQLAPELEVKKLDGTPVQLSSYKGKLLLLTFGSYTSPSFRQRVGPLDELRRDFGARINFVIVYTREAHPTGTWEVDRNRDEEISVADHKDEAERRAAAKNARDRLRLGSFIITTDSMNNATATAYHGWPNAAAVLIGRDGTVLAYQQWFDAYLMRDAISNALAGKPTTTNSK
jgi:hypothetical protein